MTKNNDDAALLADGQLLELAYDAYGSADAVRLAAERARERVYVEVQRIEARILAARAHTAAGRKLQKDCV